MNTKCFITIVALFFLHLVSKENCYSKESHKISLNKGISWIYYDTTDELFSNMYIHHTAKSTNLLLNKRNTIGMYPTYYDVSKCVVISHTKSYTKNNCKSSCYTKEANEESVIQYPNPFINRINLKFQISDKYLIILSDIEGREIYRNLIDVNSDEVITILKDNFTSLSSIILLSIYKSNKLFYKKKIIYSMF